MNKYTEIIDKYLGGELSTEDKIAFEKLLETNLELKTELELQKQILKGIDRAGIKSELKKGFKKGSFKAKSGKWFLGIIIAALAVSTVLVVKNKLTCSQNNIQYELNEENNKQWNEADKQLDAQVFNITADKDTVIETKGGIILTIPANAFLNNNSNVSGNVELEIKEALTPLDIMKAGLSTTSNGQLLETGGMFYINARQNNTYLSIAKNKGIYTSIPDNNPGKKMMLFDGKRMENGQINWVNPKSFESKLNTVDILKLNFYPPNFLDSLKNFGIDIKNKKLTDSIYYSFVCGQDLTKYDYSSEAIDFDNLDVRSDSLRTKSVQVFGKKVDTLVTINRLDGATLFKQNCSVCHSTGKEKLTGPGLAGVTDRVPKGNWLVNYILNNEKMIKSGDTYANKIYKENGKAAMTVFEGQLTEADVKAIIYYIDDETELQKKSISSPCEIAPSRIHAIWDKKFNNTLLATKEFEERLQAIFKTCNHSILDLYIKNMNKKMYEIDSIVSQMLHEDTWDRLPTFRDFYNRRDGGVSLNEGHMKKLQAYMEEKRKIYDDAVKSAMQKLYEKEKIEDKKAYQQRIAQNNKEGIRINTVFQEELTTNMKEAYRQLGKEYKPTPIRGNYLGITLVSTGWKNVDAYVLESTLSRTTLDYIDKDTGKKAIIRYEPFSVTISEKENYDRVVAYLIPDKLSSFQRMKDTLTGFKENLNELFSYSAVVFGFKGEEIFCQTVKTAKPGSVNVSLSKISRSEIEQYRNLNVGASRDIISELNYQLFEQKDQDRKKVIAKREELRKRMWPIVFPCNTYPQQQAVINN